MQYTAITIEIFESSNEKMEIIVALLDSLNYEGITEMESSVIAYMPTTVFDRNILELTLAGVNGTIKASVIKQELIDERNWNEEWEKNYSPVIIDNRCVIRAPFHEEFSDVEYVINIEPKMAFGTGHHETTSLVISRMLSMDFKNKVVLDMGCGTGVLGILAAKKGASEIIGIDNDNWAYENAMENVRLNKVEMSVILGNADSIPEIEFDIILANINRNILIEQASEYHRVLNSCGRVLISGILADDIEMVEATFVDLGMTPVNHTSLGNWQMIEFVK